MAKIDVQNIDATTIAISQTNTDAATGEKFEELTCGDIDKYIAVENKFYPFDSDNGRCNPFYYADYLMLSGLDEPKEITELIEKPEMDLPKIIESNPELSDSEIESKIYQLRAAMKTLDKLVGVGNIELEETEWIYKYIIMLNNWILNGVESYEKWVNPPESLAYSVNEIENNIYATTLSILKQAFANFSYGKHDSEKYIQSLKQLPEENKLCIINAYKFLNDIDGTNISTPTLKDLIKTLEDVSHLNSRISDLDLLFTNSKKIYKAIAPSEELKIENSENLLLLKGLIENEINLSLKNENAYVDFLAYLELAEKEGYINLNIIESWAYVNGEKITKNDIFKNLAAWSDKLLKITKEERAKWIENKIQDVIAGAIPWDAEAELVVGKKCEEYKKTHKVTKYRFFSGGMIPHGSMQEFPVSPPNELVKKWQKEAYMNKANGLAMYKAAETTWSIFSDIKYSYLDLPAAFRNANDLNQWMATIDSFKTLENDKHINPDTVKKIMMSQWIVKNGKQKEYAAALSKQSPLPNELEISFKKIKNKVDEIKNAEDLLFYYLNQNNLETLFKILDDNGIIDSIIQWAAIHGVTISSDDIKYDDNNWAEKILKIVCQERANLIDAEIDWLVKISIPWDRHVTQIIITKIKEYKKTHDDAEPPSSSVQEWVAKEIDDTEKGRKFYKKAEAVWMKYYGTDESYLELPDKIRSVKDFNEWLKIYKLLHFPNIKKYIPISNVGTTITTQCLIDYANGLKNFLNNEKFPFWGNVYGYAANSANIFLTDDKLRIPDDITTIDGLLKELQESIEIVESARKIDDGSNFVGSVQLGILSVMAGIYFGAASLGYARLAITSGLGWEAGEMTLAQAAATKAMTFTASTAGFTVGSNLVKIPIQGILSPKEYAVDFAENLAVFGALEVGGYMLGVGMGLRPAFNNFKFSSQITSKLEGTFGPNFVNRHLISIESAEKSTELFNELIDDAITLKQVKIGNAADYSYETTVNSFFANQRLKGSLGYNGVAYETAHFFSTLEILRNTDIGLASLHQNKTDSDLPQESYDYMLNAASLLIIMMAARNMKLEFKNLHSTALKNTFEKIYQMTKEVDGISIKTPAQMSQEWAKTEKYEGTFSPEARLILLKNTMEKLKTASLANKDVAGALALLKLNYNNPTMHSLIKGAFNDTLSSGNGSASAHLVRDPFLGTNGLNLAQAKKFSSSGKIDLTKILQLYNKAASLESDANSAATLLNEMLGIVEAGQLDTSGILTIEQDKTASSIAKINAFNENWKGVAAFTEDNSNGKLKYKLVGSDGKPFMAHFIFSMGPNPYLYNPPNSKKETKCLTE